MRIKSKTLRTIIVKIDSYFRKIYSKIFFYIVWLFYLKWNVRKEDMNDAKYVWDDMYKSATLKEYQDKLFKYKWESDALYGLFDMTYEYVWLNFIPSVTKKFGRDCDDFAEMTYRWMTRVGYSEVVQILYTPEDLRRAHFIVLGKQGNDDNFIIKSNYSYAIQSDSSDYKEAMKEYIERFESDKNIAWVVYRKENN